MDVRASAGRWSVEGARLTWWYDVPSEAEGEVCYEIWVDRRGRGRGARRGVWAEAKSAWRDCCVVM